jgi:hypothetical protein
LRQLLRLADCYGVLLGRQGSACVALQDALPR